MKLIPTILCGGAGSRLWPVSRELHPKPFIRLADGQSLLQKAWLRGAVLPDVAETLTVTNRELFFKTEDEYREVAAIPGNQDLTNRFILEPFGRNTAPAIAALQVAATHGEDACLLVLAADYLIADQTAFAQAVATAMQLAAEGKLVTFGIQPDMPETGYGYIEADLDSPLTQAGRAERGGRSRLCAPQGRWPRSASPASHRAPPVGHLHRAGRGQSLQDQTHRSQKRWIATLLPVHQKFRHAAGVVEIVVWRVGLPIDPSLHQFKYRLVYVLDGARVVGYDNERGKGDHKHLGLAEVAYNFVDVQTLLADFWNDVEEMT